jgi:NAD(P)-dependent dehydrogenase (short-subunit alcohol dehydrogenase family)
MELKGKVAIVTGAAGVIGRGICNVLVNEGMRMVVADLEEDAVQHVAHEMRNFGENVIGISVDVTSNESILKMVQKVLDVFGRIDALINNAGIIVAASLLEHTEEDFDRIIGVNLKGAFLCAKAVAPHMVQNKSGRIINISSVAAKRSGPLESAYTASKSGMIGLTQVWCQELGPYNITVNAVCPGFIDSGMWQKHLNPALAPIFNMEASNFVDKLAKQLMPLGRPQTPEDIGEAVAYFCKAENTSGQALVVDGGFAMW